MEKSERLSEQLPADHAPKRPIRQTLSTPLLGTCMYPEIGLAGSGTGTGQFRKNFMKERRESQGESLKARNRTESCKRPPGSTERLEGVLAEGIPSSQSLSLSRCDSGLTACDSCSSVPNSPGGSEVQGERRRRFTVNSSSTASVEELLPAAAAKTAAKGRFSIADGSPLVGPVDRRLGSLVSRGRIFGPNRKFEVQSPSLPRTFVAAEASALPPASASASASALPPWIRSASAGDVSRVRRRSASPTESLQTPESLPEEGLWPAGLSAAGLSAESSMGRLLVDAEGGTSLLDAMALPRDAPGAPPAPQPLRMLAGLLEAQRGSTGRRCLGGAPGGAPGGAWDVPRLAARCPCGRPPLRIPARLLRAAL